MKVKKGEKYRTNAPVVRQETFSDGSRLEDRRWPRKRLLRLTRQGDFVWFAFFAVSIRVHPWLKIRLLAFRIHPPSFTPALCFVLFAG
jgi:hypothetical protein